MKKLSIVEVVAVIFVFCSLLIMGGQAVAAPDRLNWGSQVNASQCGSPPNNLVINVNQHITGDIDSGCAGNYWAYDEYNKHVQVWQIGDGSFCVDVRYVGSFTTVAGQSPGTGCGGSAAILTSGIEGTYEGGYTANVIGTLRVAPSKKTKGNIGSIDFGCDTSTGECPGYASWLSYYFDTGYNFSYTWWGWIYHGGNNGTWVNTVPPTGNSGDIIP